MKSHIHEFVVDLISALLIVLFVYAALSKALDLETFKDHLERSYFKTGERDAIALLLPAGEVFVAVLLSIEKFKMTGLYLAFLLMLLFTLYVGGMITFRTSLPCACGGVLENMSWKEHLLFNIVFLFLSFIGIQFKRQAQTNEQHRARG